MSALVLAFDPGLSGPGAVVHVNRELLAAFDLPLIGDVTRRRINATGLADLVREHGPAAGLEVRDAPLADWPDCLAAAEPPRPVPYVRAWPRPAGTAYSMSAENKLRGLARYVVGSPSGQRNATVYWAACRMAELMNVGAVDPAFAQDVLIEAAVQSGLTKTEARRTVKSALRRVV